MQTAFCDNCNKFRLCRTFVLRNVKYVLCADKCARDFIDNPRIKRYDPFDYIDFDLPTQRFVPTGDLFDKLYR